LKPPPSLLKTSIIIHHHRRTTHRFHHHSFIEYIIIHHYPSQSSMRCLILILSLILCIATSVSAFTPGAYKYRSSKSINNKPVLIGSKTGGHISSSSRSSSSRRSTSLSAAAKSGAPKKKKAKKKKSAKKATKSSEAEAAVPAENEVEVVTFRKPEFVSRIAEKTGMSKADSEAALSAVLETITEEVASGKRISMLGFGTFKLTHRKARKGRNPKTGEPIDIAASKSPSFSAGKAFKERCNL